MIRRLLSILAVGLAFSAGFAVADSRPVEIPVCHEDEVLTFDGICVSPDGPSYVDYVGGVGWMID